MHLTLLLFVISHSKSNAETVLKRLETHWEGFMSISADDNSNVTISFMTMDCNSSPGKLILSCDIQVSKFDIHTNFFIKAEEEDNTKLLIVNKIGEELCIMKILPVPLNDDFVLRGIHSPKNDQVTISLGFVSLDVAVTDQFSANATVASLRRSSPNHVYNQIGSIGILVIVAACVLFFLYKASDLSDVIRPDEGAAALRIKHTSIATDRRSRDSGSKRKQE